MSYIAIIGFNALILGTIGYFLFSKLFSRETPSGSTNLRIYECLEEFISINERIIKSLENEVVLLKTHRQNCNIARTIGKSSSISGSALLIGSLLAAPITGGVSIALLGGMGMTMSLGGAGVTIGTDIAEYCISKTFQNDFEKIVLERNDVSERLQKQFIEIFEQQSEIQKHIKDEDEALLIAFKCAKDNMIIDAGSLRDFLIKGTHFKTISQARYFTNIFSRAGPARCTSPKIITSPAGKNLWKDMRLLSKNLASVLSKLGIATTKKTAMNIVRRGTIILNVAFVAWDIKSIVDDWKTGNATAEAMELSIKSIQNELDHVKNLTKIVNEL